MEWNYATLQRNECLLQIEFKSEFQVVSASRPLNSWHDYPRHLPISSADTVQKDLSAEEKRSASIIKKPTGVQCSHINFATLSGKTAVCGALNGKKSSCVQSATSISPASVSSNTEASISTAGSSTVSEFCTDLSETQMNLNQGIE